MTFVLNEVNHPRFQKYQKKRNWQEYREGHLQSICIVWEKNKFKKKKEEEFKCGDGKGLI